MQRTKRDQHPDVTRATYVSQRANEQSFIHAYNSKANLSIQF